MSAVKGRAQRPQSRDRGAPKLLLQGRVVPEAHRKASAAAEAAGITVTDYLERLVLQDQVDATGRPLWLPPRPDTAQEELPLKTA